MGAHYEQLIGLQTPCNLGFFIRGFWLYFAHGCRWPSLKWAGIPKQPFSVGYQTPNSQQ